MKQRLKNSSGALYYSNEEYLAVGSVPGLKLRLTLIEVETFKNVGIQPNDLLTGKAHFFIGVYMIAVEGERLFHSFVNDIASPGLSG